MQFTHTFGGNLEHPVTSACMKLEKNPTTQPLGERETDSWIPGLSWEMATPQPS